MELHTINTGFFKLDGGAMFGVVPKQIWHRLNPPDDKNLCRWAMRCLLIVTDEGRRILVDTGIGDKQSSKFFGYYDLHGEDSLLGSLSSYGFSAADITDVILTHLHFDHVGGAVVRNAAGELEPRFPNAVYWSNAVHWQLALNPNVRERASFLPENFVPLQESGVVRFVEDGQELYKGVSVRFVYGHTAGMMLPQISYKGSTLVYLADLVPSAAHVKLAYVMGYDMQPLVTLSEKEDFLGKAAAMNQVLFFEHDPINECALIRRSERGDFEVTRTFALKDW